MGMSVGGGGSHNVRSDINVTPLVDVVLVLLIIFLVTMPIIMRDIPLEIPEKIDQNVDDVPEAQVIVEGFTDGHILLSGTEVDKFHLSEKIADALKSKRDKVVFVGFEDDMQYGKVVEIVDIVRGAGADKIALKMKEDKPAAGADGAGAAPSGSPQ
jgi:biopolymer transport protein ExbD